MKIEVDTESAVLNIEVASTLEALTALDVVWESFLARVPRATCFHRYDWLATWWRTFGEGAQLYLLLLYNHSHMLVGVVPLYIRSYGVKGMSFRIARWLGQGNGTLTDTLGPLFAPGYAHVGMQVALGYLYTHRHEWDMLALARTPISFVDAIRAWKHTTNWQVAIVETTGWLYIRLPGNWATFYRTLSKNLRSNLPRYRNRLQREGHSTQVEMVTEPEAVLAALPQFFALHRLRSQAEHMKRHTNYFASANSRKFMMSVSDALSRQQQIALACMRVDGHRVAMQMLLFQGDVMSLYFSGFDPQWSRYSVMMLTTKASLEYAMARKVTWVDLTAGAGSQAKRQWANEEFQTQYVLVTHALVWSLLSKSGMRIWRFTQLCSSGWARIQRKLWAKHILWKE
jgi:CelD/BcsL family acetyltransferase involved in cellulose biosynthesis